METTLTNSEIQTAYDAFAVSGDPAARERYYALCGLQRRCAVVRLPIVKRRKR